jgi:hypothetical protein
MAASVSLGKLLDKEWENKSISEILEAPVSALSGVSEGDAQKLADALGIKTIRDLGGNKHFAAAGVLVALEKHAD